MPPHRVLAGPSVPEELARLPLFSQLPPGRLDLVVDGTRQARLGRGEILVGVGDARDA